MGVLWSFLGVLLAPPGVLLIWQLNEKYYIEHVVQFRWISLTGILLFDLSFTIRLFKAAVLNFFVFKICNIYIIHHESILQTVFLVCPESLWYTYKKCLHSDYFRLVQVGTAAE